MLAGAMDSLARSRSPEDGGPLQGVVTITATAEGHGRTVVKASWVQSGYRHSDSIEVDEREQARALAHRIADQLAPGIPPDLSRD